MMTDSKSPPELKVVDELTKLGVKSSFEYPGFILITIGNINYCYGTVNGCWTGDMATDEGESLGIIEMERFAPETDHMIVAKAIQATLPKDN